MVASLVLGCTVAGAQGLSKQDRDFILKHLKTSQKGLHNATKGLSEAQWNWKPAPERWSVAECAEHLTLTENFLRGLITDRVLKTPAEPNKKDAAARKEGDDRLMKVIPDRSQKAQAPEQIRPTHQWPTQAAMLKEFDARRKATVGFIKTNKEDLRAHMIDSPIMKEMDAYQWLLLISLHTTRHTAQINEVKADPNFPKK